MADKERLQQDFGFGGPLVHAEDCPGPSLAVLGPIDDAHLAGGGGLFGTSPTDFCGSVVIVCKNCRQDTRLHFDPKGRNGDSLDDVLKSVFGESAHSNNVEMI